MSSTRVWFITGTSSGLGLNLVEQVLSAGERVVATTRNASSLDSLKAVHSSDALLVIELNLSSTPDIKSAFEKVKAHYGRIDVVVNNAGYGLKGEVESVSEDEAMRQVDINFWGPAKICREAVRFFREDNPAGIGGRILNISSAGGFNGVPVLAYYSASKFALEGFSEALSKELPPSWNIHITIIEPGGFRTAWKDGNIVEPEQHPAYAGPDTPSSKYREMVNSMEFIGDPKKAAQAMMKITKVPNPPIRLQLGPDALHVVRAKCDSVLREAEEWEELSKSTVADDADVSSLEKKLDAVTMKK